MKKGGGIMRKIVVFAVAALITMLWCAPAPVGKGKVTIKRDGYGVPPRLRG